MDAPAPSMGEARISVSSVVTIDADRAVARVVCPPFRFDSIWIVGIASGRPTVSWPRTTRGYPIIEADQPTRGAIERAVLAALAETMRAELRTMKPKVAARGRRT